MRISKKETKFKKGDRVRVLHDTLNILWHPDKCEGINNNDGGKEYTVGGVLVDFISGGEMVWLENSPQLDWYDENNLELI